MTNVSSYDEILKFLNSNHSVDAEIVFDTWEAQDSYFIVFRGEDDGAKWKYKTLDGEDDLLDFVNGTGEYDAQKIGPILESDDGEITIFYRDDAEVDGEFAIYSYIDSGNSWDGVYYLLNGFAGNYRDPVERIEMFNGALHSNNENYHILYKKN